MDSMVVSGGWDMVPILAITERCMSMHFDVWHETEIHVSVHYDITATSRLRTKALVV